MSNKLAKNSRECFNEVLSDPYVKDLIEEHKKIKESDDIDEIKDAYEMLYQDMINVKVQMYCLEHNLSDDFYDEMEEIEYDWSYPNRKKERIEMYGDCLGCDKDCNACNKGVEVDGEKYPPGVAKKINDNKKRIEELKKQIDEIDNQELPK